MSSERKRYWIIKNDKNARLPADFVSSTNRKWIEIRQCKAKFHDVLIGDVELHSDLIKRDHDCDYFVMYVNELPVKPKKYEYNTTERDVRFWFTEMDGNNIDVEYFTVECLLIY